MITLKLLLTEASDPVMVWTPGLYLPVRNILDCIRANKIMFLPKELNKEEGYFTDE